MAQQIWVTHTHKRPPRILRLTYHFFIWVEVVCICCATEGEQADRPMTGRSLA